MSRALGARFYNACRIRHPRQACWSRSTDFHRHYLRTTTRPFASHYGIEVRSTSAEAIELYDTAVSEVRRPRVLCRGRRNVLLLCCPVLSAEGGSGRPLAGRT